MFKEKLGKISTKIFYIIFALVVSITLWVYVELTVNEIQIEEVPNIEIVFINQDLLRDRNFLITSHSPEFLTVTFEAPRSELSRLRITGALTAEVDLASIASTGNQYLAYTLIYPSNVDRNAVNELGASATRITVTIDTMQERQIPVRVNYTGGTASDALIAESAVFDPLTITVRGPERVVSRLQYARVPIFRENLETTFRDDLEFVLIDDSGDVIDSEQRELLELSHETIWVTIPITELKDVPLVVEFSHGLSTSEQNTTYRIEPQTIKVSGDPVAIGNFNSIPLGTIDMTLFSVSDTRAFRIIIPDSFTNVSGETEAIVHVEVTGLDIAFRITSNLYTINPPPGHTAEIITQSVDVRLRGLNDDLAVVTPMNIRVVADLLDRGTGTSRVPARVYIDGVDAPIDPIGEYFLTVTITADES